MTRPTLPDGSRTSSSRSTHTHTHTHTHTSAPGLGLPCSSNRCLGTCLDLGRAAWRVAIAAIATSRSRCEVGPPSRSTVKEGVPCMSACHVRNHGTAHVMVRSCSCATCTPPHTHEHTHTHTHTHEHTRTWIAGVCIPPSENRGACPLPTFTPSSPSRKREGGKVVPR